MIEAVSTGVDSGAVLLLALVPACPGLRAGGDCDGNFPAMVEAIWCMAVTYVEYVSCDSYELTSWAG